VRGHARTLAARRGFRREMAARTGERLRRETRLQRQAMRQLLHALWASPPTTQRAREVPQAKSLTRPPVFPQKETSLCTVHPQETHRKPARLVPTHLDDNGEH
jgi:hypothetical protein